MTAVVATAAQQSPVTPPHYRPNQPHIQLSAHLSASRIRLPATLSSSSLFSAALSPYRTSALYRSTSLLSPTSSATVHSAARALTHLRSPNRFEAPLDDDDDEQQYREHTTVDGSEGEDEADEKYPDDDDERQGATDDGLVDLSALLLQLRVDKRRTSPHRQRLVSPARRLAFQPPSRSPSKLLPLSTATSDNLFPAPSLLVVPSPLESSIALTLNDMQRQYVERAEQAIDARLAALQAALQSALAPAVASSASSSPLSPLSTLTSLHSSSRPPIQLLANEWHSYHAALQRDYKQKLEAMLAAEERKRLAREEEESRQRQEQADAEAEAARKKKAAEEEQERTERERKEQEDSRQRDEQQKQQQEQRQREEQKQQEQRAAAQTLAGPTTVAPQPSSVSPAQAEFQSHQAQLAQLRTLAATYNSPERTKHKVLINRTITQISHTMQSVQSKSLALTTLLQQAKQSGNQAEYAWVVETVAGKLVSQGETRVALQLSSAYSFGAVVLGVCRNDSTLWSCFYAMLCERCVYAIPKYADRKSHPSQTAHMLAMGYQQHTDDKGVATWEEEQAYFERQQGYTALYAAVCQYTTPHSATSHIHSLPQAWLWLSRICNQEPRSATASVLYAFLSTAAFAMHRRYGQQMAKLLMYVRQEVLGRLERTGQAKTPARKASMARLQLWLNAELEVLRRTGQLSEPEGRQLPAGQSQSTDTLHVNDGDFRGE